MNYFLGIRQTDNVLVADFEDAATGLEPPGRRRDADPRQRRVASRAATYDGTTWRLYLDGVLETQLLVGAFTPRFDSIQHAAIGSALNSTGGIGSQTQGFFGGTLDEVADLERRPLGGADPDREGSGNPERDRPARTLGLQRLVRRRARLVRQRPATARCPARTARSSRARRSPATPNTAPVVNAGADQAVALPAAAALNGTATDDGLPGVGLTTTWSKVSGPGTVTFGNASALITTASFSVAGTYVLRLTASDGLLSTQRRPDDHGHRRRESGAGRQRGPGSDDHAARQRRLAHRHRHRRRPAGRSA